MHIYRFHKMTPVLLWGTELSRLLFLSFIIIILLLLYILSRIKLEWFILEIKRLCVPFSYLLDFSLVSFFIQGVQFIGILILFSMNHILLSVLFSSKLIIKSWTAVLILLLLLLLLSWAVEIGGSEGKYFLVLVPVACLLGRSLVVLVGTYARYSIKVLTRGCRSTRGRVSFTVFLAVGISILEILLSFLGIYFVLLGVFFFTFLAQIV